MTITSKEHLALRHLGDIAHSLNDQLDAVCRAVASLVGINANDDTIANLVLNRGSVSEFLAANEIEVSI